jgi:putative ABC transport system substrate-binding protein
MPPKTGTGIRRRDFLRTFAAASAALLPSAVVAQPGGRVHRVGVLIPSRQQTLGFIDAFRDDLRSLGYAESVNLQLDVKSAEGQLEQLPALTAELVAAHPEVIVAANTPGTGAAIAMTKSVPIVMAIVGDPVGMGFVQSLAHPGGNVTGVSNLSGELAAKRLSILKEIVPPARRIGILYNPNDPVTAPQIRDTERAAPAIGVEVQLFPVKKTAELDAVFGGLRQWPADAALWLAGQSNVLDEASVPLALRYKLPVMCLAKQVVPAGGLVSYFADHADLSRRVAVYVDKILKGAKPADLPVEQPTKFELVINLKTAKALGLTVPLSLLARADEVIE